jgi:D-alanyl-lipoteichoic acid acyltransferase DltB (MBOAT superfamily)
MEFYSTYFLLFFVPVFFLNYVLSPKYRKYLIFAASSVFILSFNILSLVIVFFLSVLFFTIAHYIYEKDRLFLYFTGIFIAISVFIFFKYYNIIGDSAILKYSLLFYKNSDYTTNIIFPIGISFYLFQSIGYLVEVHRGNIIPERNIVNFSNYLIYFPKFVAGPIERPKKLLSQLKGDIVFDYKNVTDGMKLIVFGMFQKFIIADSIKRIPDAIFYDPSKFPGLFILAGIILLSVQIYADFMGYTNIAIGLSKTLGIELSPNFKQPYYSVSLKDFWSRWHITLSLWIRDYVFLPLAYKISKFFNYQKKHSYKPEYITYVVSILIAMTLVGIWHGAGWSFALWGALHGLILAISFLTKKPREKVVKYLNVNKSILKVIRIIITFTIVTALWVFFRADTLLTSLKIFEGLFKDWHTSLLDVNALKRYIYLFGISRLDISVIIISVISIFIYDVTDSRVGVLNLLSRTSALKRWAFYYLLLLALLFFGTLNNIQNFIYQQF